MRKPLRGLTLTHTFMPDKSPRPDRSGWLFIDRYMPEATPEEQEAAYENLRGLAELLLRIDERLAQVEIDMQPPLF